MANYLLAVVAPSIAWLLRADQPWEYRFDAWGGMTVLTPAHELSAARPMDRFPLDEKTLLAFDSTIVVRLPEDVDPEDATEEFESFCNWLLRWLRAVSGQAAIPTHIAMVGTSPPELADANYEPAPPQDARFDAPFALATIQEHIGRAAIREEHLLELQRLDRNAHVSVSTGIMLDALDAHVSHDFRKAILYAAIALEAAANTVLDDAYERAKLQQPPPPNLRLVRFQVGQDQFEVKDPVHVALGAKQTFAALLHERPLYILGRSLLEDDQQLYADALKLYKTRNKIAHTGRAPEDDQHFGFDPQGCREALQTAARVLGWFGERQYHVPAGMAPTAEFVELAHR
jgi:hypothetical protein